MPVLNYDFAASSSIRGRLDLPTREYDAKKVQQATSCPDSSKVATRHIAAAKTVQDGMAVPLKGNSFTLPQVGATGFELRNASLQLKFARREIGSRISSESSAHNWTT